MITRTRKLTLADTYPLERIGRLDEILFFDIETTGFSPVYSTLYLIGCTYYEDGGWHLRQWFADTKEAETDVLHAFFAFMGQYRTLVHFNGDGFDLPYLQKRCGQLGLAYDFSEIRSYDIYKRCKPYRKVLGLDSMKQKAIERFLGIFRQDKYNGGQLIEVYKEYLMTHEDYLYDLLILHNAEDLEGMPQILPILNYPDFFEQPLTYQTAERAGSQLHLTFTSECRLPVPLKLNLPPVKTLIEESQMIFSISLYEGTLKHFYPNYRDYYYLIYEDTAVHKSIGEYVDKGARIKATKKTCYTKKEGAFLPQFAPLWEPVLQKDPKDKVTYVEFSSACLEDENCRQAYLIQLLTWIGIPSVKIQTTTVHLRQS